ncbi:carbohydrate-binding family 9-like protein [Pedobacter cryophilus]|uniref:Carbohydrate-binding domain-containing protein n=1 Tax=Pedobacter cryophilus TaxID=2571271 RepID=A0A4U1C4A7_9SPHI|nr:carbohydrate-binding family 9-like protein [Pedobacter cryophilus]TKC00203.1 hypothetical protein FA046_00545 [Pedobacter cryophilus]
MKNLFLPFTDSIDVHSDIEEVAALMDTFPKNYINHQPWPEFTSKSQTRFAIAHSGNALFLKYYVCDDVIKVAMHQTNDQVHKDNCVEFFVAFASEKEYYNIELNCLGVCLMAYGNGRSNRKNLSEEIINKIQRSIIIKSAPANSPTNFEWQITLVIPIEVFQFNNFESFAGQNGYGNFFKCGDDLPEPHFFAWNMIKAPSPDFHLPEFFGAIEFGGANHL